ncbi:MAG TPA: PQQ-binding-like beta-propeller repeat protein [Verrucomicrobiae bacterium]|nr:PQQ-binding-like beta-propeller repeat protein [Verrucomicrobiae bacterium]
MRRGSLLLAVCLAVAFDRGARAEDWPQFRGPRRDSTWEEEFRPGGLKVEWKHPAGGGWASPVVASGRVFVFDVELVKPARERLRCFDVKTGKVIWDFSYVEPYGDWAYVPERGAGPTATPIVEGDRIYAVGANGWTHCLDCRSGKLIWEKRIGKELEVAEMSCRPSPLIDGSLLIVFTGAKPGASVMALDKKTGKEVWRSLDDTVSNSSPIVISSGTKRQMIVWSANALTSLDPASGGVFWREAMTTSGNDSAATPVFQDGKLLVSGLMLDVRFDPPTGDILWPKERGPSKRLLSNTSTAVMRGEHIYGARGSGELVCLEVRTGREVWSTNSITSLKNGASIHIVAQGGGYFLFTDEGNLIRAEMSPAGYREVSRARLIYPVYEFAGHKLVWAPPAFANGRVFVRSEGEVVCGSLKQ